MSLLRHALILGVFLGSLIWTAAPSSAAQIRVGAFIVNEEAAFAPGATTFALPMKLAAQTRLLVQYSAQYSSDFGIIPAADLTKWQNGLATRYLVRMTATTAARYVTLNAGNYYVVARDLSGASYNGFAMKVRRFKGFAVDNGVSYPFVSSKVWAQNVLPQNWNGIAFGVPKGGRFWFQGVFCRGQDHAVKWEILTAVQYDKFLKGQPYTKLLTGTEPKPLYFEFVAVPATYYFIVKNTGNTLSSFAATRELYR